MASAHPPEPLSAGHVLAVDDDEFMRVLLTVYLEAAGYSVETAASGQQALAAARRRSFDAVILDVNMPGELDGVAVGNALRADPATQSSAIAMHTSESEATVRSSGFGDFDAFMAKPCSPRTLEESVAAMLEARRSRGREPKDG